jgi:hypothetical protein
VAESESRRSRVLASAAAIAEGLIVQANGTVYDTNQNVTWLADANFAVSSEGEAVLEAARITSVAPSGIMDYYRWWSGGPARYTRAGERPWLTMSRNNGQASPRWLPIRFIDV